MPIFANNIIVGGKTIKKEGAKKPLLEPVQNELRSNIEEQPRYKIIKEGDLEKYHNTKSEYLNDMTGFENQ